MAILPFTPGDHRPQLRIAMRQGEAFFGNDERVPRIAHSNTVHHSPQLFELQLADEPSTSRALR